MPRPGFVLEVDERTPPLLVHEGEGFRVQKFPLGSRVIYPPDSLPGLSDPNAAVRNALLDPIGSEPLPELLKPGMKLTIAADDVARRPPARARERARGRGAPGRRRRADRHRQLPAPPDDASRDQARGR